MNPVCVRVIWVESRVARLLELFQRHFVFQRDTVGYFHPFRKLSYMGKPCTKLKTKQNVLVWQHNRSWIFYYSEVATEPPMDLLISKLVSPYRLAWHSLNKAVSLSLQRCWPGSVTDTFQVCHANGSGLSHILTPCVFVIVTVCTFQFMLIHGTSFSLLLSKLFQTFAFGVTFKGLVHEKRKCWIAL